MMTGPASATFPRLAAMLSGLPEAEVVTLLARMVDALPVGVALYDASDDDFRVLYLNRASELLASPVPDVLGRPFLEAYPDAAQNRVLEVFRKVRDSGEAWHSADFTTLTGRSWDIQATPLAAPDGRVHHLLLVGHDTTDQAVARRQLEVGLDLAISLGATLEPREVIRTLLERVAGRLAADRVTLTAVEGDELWVVGSWDTAGAPDWTGRRYPASHLASQPLLVQALETGRVVLGGGLDAAAAAEDVRAELEPVRRTAILTLRLGGEQRALLLLSRRQDRPFTEADAGTLGLVANVASFALRNANLFSEVQTARVRTAGLVRRLQLGLDLALDLAAQLEHAEVVSRLLHRVVAAVGADRGTLLRVEGDELVVEESLATGGRPLDAGTRWPAAAAPAFVRAIREQVPATGTGPPGPAGGGSRGAGDRWVGRHFLVVPLVIQGEVAALLTVSRGSGPAFSEEDAAAVTQVGNVAALRIRNVRLLAEAQAALQAKGDFLNLAAHELRTPYTVINGYLSLMVEGALGPPPETWRRPLEALSLKSHEMGLLIDKLLSASRVDSPEFPVELVTMDLRQALRAAVERAQPRARLLAGELVLELPPAPLPARADPAGVGRVLDNLVDNALTYGGPEPWVRLSARRRRRLVEVSVEDRGLGIPPEAHDRVFERFYRLEAHSWKAPGTGLGLYIARRLTERCGGTLELERSAEGEGSRFVLRLAAADPEPVSVSRPGPRSGPGGGGRRPVSAGR